MTADALAGCPPAAEHEIRFSSLGAIDRIGDAFRQSPQNLLRVADVQLYRSFRMRCLATTLGIVDACHVPANAAFSVRLKRLDSIRRKIGRTGANFTLGRLDDVVGLRVICQDLSTAREFSVRILDSPHFFRRKDYIAAPAATGYRGLHHIIRLKQPVTETAGINVRFEIQVRTCLQHRWAVWSESRGEAVKLGAGEHAEHQRLRALSEAIARWEAANPDICQLELPAYSGGRSVAVCWRTRHGPVIPYYFQSEVRSAVDWLNYLETTYAAERENALLLVGVSEEAATWRLLELTHPLYTGARVLDPRYWMPSSTM